MKGKFFVTILGIAPSAGMPDLLPRTVLSVVEERVITNDKGTLTVLGVGILDSGPQANSEFDLLSRVSSGTGLFKGATGVLHIRGNGLVVVALGASRGAAEPDGARGAHARISREV